jgi:DNA polymerase-1
MLEYQDILNELAYAVWGKPINPNSPKQLCDFFYNELKLPVQYKFNKLTKEKTPSTDRAAMEKLTLHWVASPFVNLIGELRDASKKLSVLRRGIGDDGRMRCSYNVTGTETGRWSSNQSVWGDGTNLQNITESLRKMFVADPGKVLIYADGEQAESRLVGAIIFKLFGDSLYLDACEEGDLHTTVTKLVWKTLGWTSDAKRDRLIAEAPFYRHFSYRDMAKRGGHGTNYRGSAFVMAQHLKVPRPLIEAFQLDYFNAFPGIPRWHRHRQAELLRKPEMTTLFGRTRQFFGRPSDDHTLKEAIAFEPQSCVGDLINEGMLRVWNQRKPLGFDLLMQVHDNIIGQVDYDEHLPRKVAAIKELFAVPFDVSGRTIVIPSEIKTGWNWGNFDATRNPDGLKKWTGSEQRRRLEDPEASVLDRVLY